MSAEEDSPFGTLPVELKWKIFGFLKFTEKKKARLVCSHWQAIIKEKLKRVVILTDKTKPGILYCHRGHVKSLTVRNLKKITSMSSLQDSIHCVDECVIGCGNFAPNILNIVQLYSNGIKRLRIQNLSLMSVKAGNLSDVLRNTKWSNLSSLSITMGAESGVGTRSQNHVTTTIQIFKSLEVTTLKCLTVYFKPVFFEVPWNNIFDFILKNQECLRELKLKMQGQPIPARIQGYEKFSQFKDLKLHKFAVKYDDRQYSEYVRALCLQLRGLVHLEIESELHYGYDYSRFGYSSEHIESKLACKEFKVENILGLHKKTLKIFRCKFCLFDLHWLHGCSGGGGLESLRILELMVNELVNIEMMPSLHNLKKCSIFEYSGTFATDSFLGCMVDRMPNLEEVEFFPNYGWKYFKVTHLRILQALPWLRKITVGHTCSPDNSLKNFCQSTPGLTLRTEVMSRTSFTINLNMSVQIIQIQPIIVL